MAETEGYYQLLHEQIHKLSTSLNDSEEASQLKDTAKSMLEALRQCIHVIKDSQLSDSNLCRSNSLEPSPAPEDVPTSNITSDKIPTPSTSEGPSPPTQRHTETTSELRYFECKFISLYLWQSANLSLKLGASGLPQITCRNRRVIFIGLILKHS